MKERGTAYAAWSRSGDPGASYSSIARTGLQVDVQTRFIEGPGVQVFIGVYKRNGRPIYEEFFPLINTMTLSSALRWAIGRADLVASNWIIFGPFTTT